MRLSVCKEHPSPVFPRHFGVVCLFTPILPTSLWRSKPCELTVLGPLLLQRMNKMYDTPVDGDDTSEHVLGDAVVSERSNVDRRTRDEISSLQSALSVMEQANKFIGMWEGLGSGVHCCNGHCVYYTLTSLFVTGNTLADADNHAELVRLRKRFAAVGAKKVRRYALSLSTVTV